MRKRTVLRTLITNEVKYTYVDKVAPEKGIQSGITYIYGVLVTDKKALNYITKHTPENYVIVDVSIVEQFRQVFEMDEPTFCELAEKKDRLPLNGENTDDTDEDFEDED